MPKSVYLVGLLLGASLLGSGCGVGRFVGRGMNCYWDGNYDCAMAQWRDLEHREAEMNQKGRVRYLVFRGLTHFRRQEMAQAQRFLTLGEQAYRAGDPGWLPRQALGEMQQAQAQLAQKRPLPGQPGQRPPRGAQPEPAPGAQPPPDQEPITIQ